MSKDLNTWTATGRFSRDPELKTTQNGKPMLDFSIAVDQSYGENEQVVWVNCRAWNKTAETISKYFNKGSRIMLQGSFRNDSWKKDDSTYASYPYLLVNEFFFLDSKKDSQKSPDKLTYRGKKEEAAPQNESFNQSYSVNDAFDDTIF